MTNTPGSTAPKTLVILGATSGIAHAYLRIVAAKHPERRFILIARNVDALDVVRRDISGRSQGDVTAIAAKIAAPGEIPSIMAQIVDAAGSIDECLIAYGALGEQLSLQNDLPALQALLTTNFVSVSLWLEALTAQFNKQAFGHAMVIGSVAGDRGRKSNYLYGATKAGLECLCEGMAHRFASEKDIHVTCIKPGLVDTAMTAHLRPSGALWSTPERVANDIYHAVQRKRVRIYTPWFWRMILLAVRALPVSLFHKTRL